MYVIIKLAAPDPLYILISIFYYLFLLSSFFQYGKYGGILAVTTLLPLVRTQATAFILMGFPYPLSI
jgi:hypothetical protein